MRKLVTKNLLIKPLKADDITPLYVKALNDPEIVQLTGARFTKWNIGNLKTYVLKANGKDKSMLLGIFLKTDSRHIGNIRLFNFDRHHRRVELGIMIFDKAEWKKGYATEALAVVCKFVFEKLKLHRICADYYSVNRASAKMFKKTGFKIEGIFKDHFICNHSYVDSVRVAKINS